MRGGGRGAGGEEERRSAGAASGAAVEGAPSGKAATIRERLALAKLARGHHPSLRPLCDVSQARRVTGRRRGAGRGGS